MISKETGNTTKHIIQRLLTEALDAEPTEQEVMQVLGAIEDEIHRIEVNRIIL